jgi:hypothetical protein
MARKATHKTPNEFLISGILDDQAAFMLHHLKHSDKRRGRITHNLKELFRRLGEDLPKDSLFYE